MEYKKDLRVLHLVTGLLGGGAERFTVDLAKQQLVSGKNVLIVSLADKADTLVDELRNDKVPFALTGMTRNPFNFFSSVRRLRKLIGEFHPHIIHCHMFHPLVVVFLALAGRAAKPGIVFTPHSFNIGSRLRECVVYLTRGWRDVDTLFSRNMVRRFYKKEAISIIPNGIRMMPVADTPKRKRFTFINVAGLRPEKNQIAILDAVKRLKAKGIHDFDVWIAGDGPLKESLISYKETHQLQNVRFLGYREDVYLLLQQVHCFILPSLWEGLPLSVLEAASFGLPVICTRAGGLEEYFNENEFLYTGKEAGQIADAMHKVLENDELYFRNACVLRERVRSRFSMHAIELEYDKLYKDIRIKGGSS